MSAHRVPSRIIARIDGASRGNPGPAAYGVVVESEEGEPVARLSKSFGRATNNVAEYCALLAALDYALQHRVTRLKVYSDSELLARQIQGHYKVRSADLAPLHERARNDIARLDAFSIQHVPREENREADCLANRALDGVEEQRKGGDSPGSAAAREPAAARSEPMRLRATYRDGILRPDRELSLGQGEEVEIEVRRKN